MIYAKLVLGESNPATPVDPRHSGGDGGITANWRRRSAWRSDLSALWRSAGKTRFAEPPARRANAEAAKRCDGAVDVWLQARRSRPHHRAKRERVSRPRRLLEDTAADIAHW